MTYYSSGDSRAPQALLRILCSKLTGLKDEALTPYYKIALTTLGSTIRCEGEGDAFEVAEKIKKKLVRQHREKDAALFAELDRKLQSQNVLKNHWAVLFLLLRLSEDPAKSTKKKKSRSAFVQGLTGHAMSTPFYGQQRAQQYSQTAARSVAHSDSSGFSSIHGSSRSSEQTPVPQSLPPSSYVRTPGLPLAPNVMPQGSAFESHRPPRTGMRLYNAVERTESSISSVSQRQMATGRYKRSVKTREPVNDDVLSEGELVREMVYIFQGIEGKYIQHETNKDGFRLNPRFQVPRALRIQILKLAECGWLFNKVRKYADSRSTDRAFGLVGQSFCAALHQQLTEYYRLMAVLDAQLTQEEDEGVQMTGQDLTLRRLAVWTHEPLVRLRALAALVDVCQAKKGGMLASAIHSYIQHGDPAIRSLIKNTLTLVGQPIFTTIMKWLYDGELEDTYHEFFVASDPTVKDDQLWHGKYSLRTSMVPSFITTEQAKKILLTGKSINFLRQVCQDRTAIRNRDVIKASETHEVESIFMQDLDGTFAKMVDTVYMETSQHLLEVLHTKYKFMDHLKAMRRYLLLGQGDFVRHLMDLLEEDLAKPAATLFLHNLTGILETAIRATNAQFDDGDILKRLDVRLLEVSPGDTGWDVFSLDYHVDGPIRTVFTPECCIMYLRVFNFLWRAKRMEYILAGIWKGQMANTRLLKSMPELAPVLHKCHVICSEMIHFIQQVQYYISFEVLECSWDALLKKVKQAEDLDHIIAAHQEFLDTIIASSLLDPKSKNILTQLRTIFDLIIQFQNIQDNFFAATFEELLARQQYEDNIRQNNDQGQWGLTQEIEDQEKDRRAHFCQTAIPNANSQLRLCADSYQQMAGQFLVMLHDHEDVSLRFLSFRLDFNEHYRAKEPKLRTSSTFHRSKRK